MAVHPDYYYSATPGECSIRSKWHLSVDVSEFIDMNRLLYCPAQDYEPTPKHVRSRTAVGAWVHDRIDFWSRRGVLQAGRGFPTSMNLC